MNCKEDNKSKGNQTSNRQMWETKEGRVIRHAHEILIQRESAGRHQLIWAISGFFLLNSLLTWVFFMAVKQNQFHVFAICVAAVGVVGCVVTWIVLSRFALELTTLADKLNEIEKDPYFSSMAKYRARPFVDMASTATRPRLKWEARALAYIPFAGVLLWMIVLAEWVFN